VLEDGRAQFSVNALVSAGSLTYQWQDNRSGSMANITDGSGATSAAYTTSPARVEQNGRQVRCVVTDSNGSTNTNTVSLSVVRYAYPQFPRKRKQWGGMSMGVNIREWW
jgi:beta-galactosidase